MNQQRYSPRLTGCGRQFIGQALGRNLIKVILTPTLKAKIRKEFGCTDKEIDDGIAAGKARIRDEFGCTDKEIDDGIAAGITEFGNEFQELLAKQRAEMIPPKEDDGEQ